MSLADAFAGMQRERESSGSQVPKRVSAVAPKLSPPAKGFAKSAHPDFEPKKVYLRKDTVKQAVRRFEDTTGGDMSDLVQMLLEKYMEGR